MFEEPGYKFPSLNISFESGNQFLFVLCQGLPSLFEIILDNFFGGIQFPISSSSAGVGYF
jgi:hypothetical protein